MILTKLEYAQFLLVFHHRFPNAKQNCKCKSINKNTYKILNNTYKHIESHIVEPLPPPLPTYLSLFGG